jgi:hypothetical protein
MSKSKTFRVLWTLLESNSQSRKLCVYLHVLYFFHCLFLALLVHVYSSNSMNSCEELSVLEIRNLYEKKVELNVLQSKVSLPSLQLVAEFIHFFLIKSPPCTSSYCMFLYSRTGWSMVDMRSWKRKSQQMWKPLLVPTASQLWCGSRQNEVISPVTFWNCDTYKHNPHCDCRFGINSIVSEIRLLVNVLQQ